jgi:ubiquinone/menaquinone biosynthesis C-methylase UbiE
MSADASDVQLERLRHVWAELGRDDPLWAVLSRPDTRGGRWDVEKFLETGQAEIQSQLEWFAQHDLPRRRHHALDFGCGAGRLSRALSRHFDQVTGVDVSPGMLAKARALNEDLGNIDFVENATPALAFVPDQSVDFVYSCMTLQHIPADLAFGYVAEFFRIVAPGGVVAFQFVAGHDASWRGRVFSRIPNRWLNPLRRLIWRRQSVFEMHVLAESRLEALIAQDANLHVIARSNDGAAGQGWHGRRWYVMRAE